MKVREFLKLVSKPDRTNYFVIASDDFGLPELLQRALEDTHAPEDLTFLNAEGLSKDRARETEREARQAPRGGSAMQTTLIYHLQKLPAESAGPLLKATEDARWTRFIFQAQSTPLKIRTLQSRCTTVKLTFLPKDTVLANLKAMSLDAKTADELNLCDGTIAGTARNLRTKDDLTAIRRELSKGARGLAALFQEDGEGRSLLTSEAFGPATEPHFTEEELAFNQRGATPEGRRDRKKITTYLLSGRSR